MRGVTIITRLLRRVAERVRRRRMLVVIASALAVVLYFAYVPVRVRILIWERGRSPGGNIDIFWVGRRVEAIDADLRSFGPSAYPVIIECERPGHSSTMRIGALDAIGELGIHEGRTVLLAVAADASASEYFRLLAIRSLGKLQDANAVPLLVELALSPKTSPSIYDACLSALGRIRDASCVGALVELYHDRRWEQDIGKEGTLVETLGCFADDPRVRSLLKKHAASSKNAWIRGIISDALRGRPHRSEHSPTSERPHQPGSRAAR